ncbi:MAG: SIR2 family protein [Candidatus Omnitrophota bacterium]
METKTKNSLNILARGIIDGSCIVFIGAGVSHDKNDSDKGFPLGNQLLSFFQKDYEYTIGATSPDQAAFLVKNQEGNNELEKFLKKNFDCSKKEPLPCHNLLAELDFCHYISLNFDILLEKALKNIGKNYNVIINDSDLTKIDAGKEVPLVFKLHGSVDVSGSMCLATDDIYDFRENKPIIFPLLATLFASKKILFLGFRMQDPDFISLITYFHKVFKGEQPQSIAVVKEKELFVEAFVKKFKIDVVEHDATSFLEKLIEEVKVERDKKKEGWRRNLFFDKKFENYSPTETQIIEFIINKAERKLENNQDISVLKKDVKSAIQEAIKDRNDFSRLKTFYEKQLEPLFQDYKPDDLKSIQNALKRIQNEFQQAQNRLKERASKILDGSKKILLYSFSQNVICALLGLSPDKQSDIELYLCECQPRSNNRFQDAIAIAKYFENSLFRIRFLEDSAAYKYINKKEIDLVLLGATYVYKDDEKKYKYFINTCGTLPILKLAKEKEIPINVVFDKSKIIKPETSWEEIKKDPWILIKDNSPQIKPIIDIQEALNYKVDYSLEPICFGYDALEWDDQHFTAITDETD